jgi:hypothetical protein
MEKMELYNKFRAVPEDAKKKISGGRLNGMTDINPMWRIKMLTDAFGACGFGWWYEITSQRIEDGSDNQKAAFVDIKLYVKQNEIVSQPIYGIGGSSFVTKETAKHYTSDECFKMALTDAIGNACKCLGIGADVYFEKDRTKYDLEQKQTETKNNSKEFLAKELDLIAKCESEEQLIKLWSAKINMQTVQEWKTEWIKKRQLFFGITKKMLDGCHSIENLEFIFETLPNDHKTKFTEYREELKLKLTPRQ